MVAQEAGGASSHGSSLYLEETVLDFYGSLFPFPVNQANFLGLWKKRALFFMVMKLEP